MGDEHTALVALVSGSHGQGWWPEAPGSVTEQLSPHWRALGRDAEVSLWSGARLVVRKGPLVQVQVSMEGSHQVRGARARAGDAQSRRSGGACSLPRLPFTLLQSQSSR